MVTSEEWKCTMLEQHIIFIEFAIKGKNPGGIENLRAVHKSISRQKYKKISRTIHYSYGTSFDFYCKDKKF